MFIVHSYSLLADPFDKISIDLLINVIAVQKLNCLLF